MAACFSSSARVAIPPVYVISRIPGILKVFQDIVYPGITAKSVELPDNFEEEFTLTDENKNALKEVEITVCDATLLAMIYKDMPNLKWAHCTFAGIDPLFKVIPEKPSFTITRHGTQAFYHTMAEYVLCQILNCERSSKLCWKSQQSKTWLKPEVFCKLRTLKEINVSILGVGNMGQAIAKFLKLGGARVFGFSRTSHPCWEPVFDKISTSLYETLVNCDYICNTLPDTPQTNGMLNNSALANCREKPVFINVGRGSIISEKELIHALRNNWLSGAVLDVFETEPLPEDSELWDIDQVTITPHVAAISKPDHIADGFLENLFLYKEGHVLQNTVNWSAGY